MPTRVQIWPTKSDAGRASGAHMSAQMSIRTVVHTSALCTVCTWLKALLSRSNCRKIRRVGWQPAVCPPGPPGRHGPRGSMAVMAVMAPVPYDRHGRHGIMAPRALWPSWPLWPPTAVMALMAS